jgi:ribosome-associated translation inhibitor RaiA
MTPVPALATEEESMKAPLQITFRDVPRSTEIEDRIRAKAAKLDRFYDRITGCRVVVDAPHRHRQSGNLFHVRIDLSVPGDEIVVNREPHKHQQHEELTVAIRDAFKAAERQLRDYSRKRQQPTGAFTIVDEVP